MKTVKYDVNELLKCLWGEQTYLQAIDKVFIREEELEKINRYYMIFRDTVTDRYFKVYYNNKKLNYYFENLDIDKDTVVCYEVRPVEKTITVYESA